MKAHGTKNLLKHFSPISYLRKMAAKTIATGQKTVKKIPATGNAEINIKNAEKDSRSHFLAGPSPTIIVSGFAGSGKSSLADSLGKELGIRVIHASSILREMAAKGVKALENATPRKIQDWWESSEARDFMKRRQQDGSLDRALDEKLMQIAKAGNVILDSWTMSYLYEGRAFRIWLNANAQVRAKRVSDRDRLDYSEVLAKVQARDADTKALYQRLYNFTMGGQLERFDLVIDTDALSQKEVLDKAIGALGGNGFGQG